MAAGGILAFALAKVAEGFLEASGKKIFDLFYKGLFGSSAANPNELAKAFAETLEVFANDLKLHVDQAFEKERLRRAELSLKRLTYLMRLYSTSPTTSRDLLDECAIAANDTRVVLAAIGHLAAVQYVSAVTLLIAVYEERVKAIAPEQRRTITEEIVPVGVETYKSMRGRITEEVSQRVKVTEDAKWSDGNPETPMPDGPVEITLNLVVDGRVVEQLPIGDGENEMDYNNPRYVRFRKLVDEQRAELLRKLDLSMETSDSLVGLWQKKYPRDQETPEP